MWRSRRRCVIKPAYYFSFLLSINIFVWQNVLYFLDAPRSISKKSDFRVRSHNREKLLLPSPCPSVLPHASGSLHWTDFHEIWGSWMETSNFAKIRQKYLAVREQLCNVGVIVDGHMWIRHKIILMPHSIFLRCC